MNDNKELTVASAELREMITKAMAAGSGPSAKDAEHSGHKKAHSGRSDRNEHSSGRKSHGSRRSSGKRSHSAGSGKKAVHKHSSRVNLRGGWSIQKKTGITLGFIFLALVLVMGVIVGLFFHYTGMLKKRDNSIRTDKPPVDSRDLVDEEDTLKEDEQEKELRALLEQKSRKISSKDVMNVLLIGEDIRDTATEDRGNTDVMMLISINKKNRTITLTSLMRDTWVYMEKFNVNGKLNQAYWYGGAEYLEEVIADYFSIDIDRTVKVNFMQFIDIVEAVGGLDLDVSYTEAVAMYDPMGEQNYYLKLNPDIDYDPDDDYIDLSMYGKEDWVNYYDVDGKFCTTIEYESEEDTVKHLHLNGNQSLAYARTRYGCGDDYGRTMRQRETITEIVKKAKKLNLVQLDQLMKDVLPEVETDLTEGEIAELLLNAFDYMSYDIQQLRLPSDGYYEPGVIDSQSCLTVNNWQFQANAAFLRYMVYGECKTSDEAKEQYQKEIEDGTFYVKNDFQPPTYW